MRFFYLFLSLPEDDVDLEALVNDMNSSFESLYTSCTVQTESTPLLHNGQPHRSATFQTQAQPTSPHQRLHRSQPMHILAVRWKHCTFITMQRV